MSISIANVSQAYMPQAAPPATPSGKAAPQPSAVPSDTVHLSESAQSALEESRETSAETTREARSGDLQAKRLLAEQAAAKANQAPAPKTELAPNPTHVNVVA